MLVLPMSIPAKEISASRSPRELIMQASLRLIAEKGIDAVTHRRVAASAGVSLGTTTHHFDGHAALLRESFLYYMSFGSELLEEINMTALAEVKGNSDGIERVRKLVIQMVGREFAEASLVRAEYELLLFASQDEELAKQIAAWEARLAGALAAVIETSGARRSTQSANTLVNFVRGLELERLIKPQLTTQEFDRRLTHCLRVYAGSTGLKQKKPTPLLMLNSCRSEYK